ncbi:MAG: phosphoadenosine phosphosulfate reductase [Candidatus Firestonebacteria bacterium RIFOXYC2_FULL_39_67]|nr:MAG: phosphoadenosine phosphosulfate reductase [Candidatus Firestonebacteria bacterium RIFOXYC2_FULL_39_67]
MYMEELEELKSVIGNLDAQGVLDISLDYFGVSNIALSSSFSAEDQVLTDIILKKNKDAVIFTIDTGRLPQETYDVLDKTRKKYGVDIEVLFPERPDVEEMVKKHGANMFYESVDLRRECCHIRKIVPLKRKLNSLKAWISGMRRSQSVTRENVTCVEWDSRFKLVKINPIFNWTDKQIRAYIKKNDIPYNILHDRGYPSIGCAPCTRAVKPGQDIRSGRWWWEDPEHKECGLHINKGDKNGKY